MAVFVTRLIQPIVMGTNAGDLAVGKEVILNENGQPVNYLIVNQGIPENSALYDASCEGTWLLRKDIRELVIWSGSNGESVLVGSNIMAAMAGYLNSYDQNVQESIKTVKIPYCVGNGYPTVNSGANGLECKIFPLSGYEAGGANVSASSFLPIDGACLSYFENLEYIDQRTIAYLNGQAETWAFRSPHNSMDYTVCFASKDGYINSDECTFSYGTRPALILPYEFKFTSDQIVA